MAPWSQAAALLLAGAASLAPLASGQAFYYQDEERFCSPEQAFRYLGCYATDAQPFVFNPDSWDPRGDNSRAWIEWNRNTVVNTTITPHYCADVCRAQGFKYAALWGQACRCGSSLDYQPAGGGARRTLSDKKVADAQCANDNDPCPGDRRESCGTFQAARIFVDPTFEGAGDGQGDEEDLDSLVAGYGLLGCFKAPNLPSGDSGLTSPSTRFTDTASCFRYCADLGSPLAYMLSDNGRCVMRFALPP